MTHFDVTRLHRFPDVEADDLQAHDATDLLLIRHAQDLVESKGLRGSDIVIIGDRYGAVTLSLAAAGLSELRVHQDLVTGRQALANNARTVGLQNAYRNGELDESLVEGARLVLLQLPTSLDALAEIVETVTHTADPELTLIAGGRVKHMALAMNDVLAERFDHVQPQRAERKSRLIVSTGPRKPVETTAFPRVQEYPELGLTVCAFGGVFAGTRIDIGTRVLVEHLPAMPDVENIVDLGCGTGILGVLYAMRNPTSRVTLTDRSVSAVRSAQATVEANRMGDRVRVVLDDAGSELPAASADLILINPPFHLGSVVAEEAAHGLFHAAARLLRPGGELWCVFNSALGHRRVLQRVVGETVQIDRTPKFTVTRSIRRSL